MSKFFQQLDTGKYGTSARNILIAVQFFRDNPNGRIPTGVWTDPSWDHKAFRKWLLKCLHAKISNDNRSWRKLEPRFQLDLWLDSRTVNEYYGKRIRNSGCNGLLRTVDMQKRYPHVNRQEREP